MSIIVTGAAGFIGSNLLQALNRRGETDIIAVDDLTDGEQFRNLADADIADYLDQNDFLERYARGDFGTVRALFHQGACASTLESNGRYMMENNYRYSCRLLESSLELGVPFLYASSAAVYGAGRTFREARQYERPLNVYGYSKFLFDQRVRRALPQARSQVVGLRYFNVYGPREEHKGRMASVAYHCYQQLRRDGRVELFGEHGGFPPGGHLRDFVAVEDVARVNLHFFDHPQRSGIFNLGSGQARTFNEVALAVINSVRANADQPPLSLQQAVESGLLGYREFPSRCGRATRATPAPTWSCCARRATATISRAWKRASPATAAGWRAAPEGSRSAAQRPAHRGAGEAQLRQQGQQRQHPEGRADPERALQADPPAMPRPPIQEPAITPSMMQAVCTELTSMLLWPTRAPRVTSAGFIDTPVRPITTSAATATAGTCPNRAKATIAAMAASRPKARTAMVWRSARRPTMLLPTSVARP